MTTINIGINKPNYEKYVNEIYDALSDEDKEIVLKGLIYELCYYKEDEGYHIYPALAATANRVNILPNPEEVAVAFSFAWAISTWENIPGWKEEIYQCKFCGYKFKTNQKRPFCKFCNKIDMT